MAEGKSAGSGNSRGGAAAFFRRLDIFDVFVLVAFGIVFAYAVLPRTAVDLGWHLRTGQLIWSTGAIPHSDPYSFTVNGKPWITHEWLSEVIMWPFYTTFGHAGLNILTASVTLLGLWFVYKHMRMDGSHRVAAAILMVLCALAARLDWGAMPLVSTFSLAPFYALQLRRWWLGEEKALWWLPPLMLLWVNLHGGYMMGLGLVAVYLTGSLLSTLLPTDPPRGSLRSLAIAGALCLLATLANPNTYHILWYPFDTLKSAAMRKYVLDWLSPDFHSIYLWPFALMLALFFIAPARSQRRMAVIDILLVLAVAGMSLQSNRHVQMFAVIATPVLARQLGALGDDLRSVADRFGLSRLWRQAKDPPNRTTAMVLRDWVVLVGAFVFITWKVVKFLSPATIAEVESAYFPVQAVQYIKDHDIKGRIYNAYNWGGYLILNWYPERKVFIDSRADMYRDDFMEQYFEAYYIRARWREPLDKYAVQYALLESEAPLRVLLNASREWREVYSDKVAVLLARAKQPAAEEQAPSGRAQPKAPPIGK